MRSDWFIRIQLSQPANEIQTQRLMEFLVTSSGLITYVDGTTGRTEITFYEPAANMVLAMNNAHQRVKSAINHARMSAKPVQLEIMSREDRLVELAKHGIAKESTMPNIS